jgi:hypothetical protein
MIFFVMLASCSSVNGAGSSKLKEEANTSALRIDHKAGATTIKQVIENASRMNDQQVELTGAFSGWKGCPASSMITRSDWVLEDESGCIYVSGVIPGGVSPTSPQGERIQIKGRIIVDKNGKASIKADQLTRLPN